MRLVKIEGGRINVCEPQMLTVGDTAVVSGQALVLVSGALKDAGAAKPTFIALADAIPGAKVAVGRVEPNQIYEVELSANVSTAMTVGTKYPLATHNGKSVKVNPTVSGTTANNVAELVDANGASKAGDKILVRFS